MNIIAGQPPCSYPCVESSTSLHLALDVWRCYSSRYAVVKAAACATCDASHVRLAGVDVAAAGSVR
jgi:hypothetical protein